MILKRVTYLVYYFKNLDWDLLHKFIGFVNEKKNISKLKIWKDVIVSSLRYNVSIMDYFYFKFYELNNVERESYAGTGFMYEFQLVMNPKKFRHLLENKVAFNKAYSRFIKHKFLTKEEFIENQAEARNLISNKSRKLILKSSYGQCGEGIQVLDLYALNEKEIYQELQKSSNDLIEEYIVQHNELMKLSPSGLNTVRIFTQLNDSNNVDILGARLRITIDSYVDNLAAGNIAASINIDTGLVNGPGVYSDIIKNDVEFHPVTKVQIKSFKIPFWKETLQLVKEAALLHIENRSIGWDIAITNEGPELLEGNHNWCKLLWQLPVKKGLKKELEAYLK